MTMQSGCRRQMMVMQLAYAKLAENADTKHVCTHASTAGAPVIWYSMQVSTGAILRCHTYCSCHISR